MSSPAEFLLASISEHLFSRYFIEQKSTMIEMKRTHSVSSAFSSCSGHKGLEIIGLLQEHYRGIVQDLFYASLCYSDFGCGQEITRLSKKSKHF